MTSQKYGGSAYVPPAEHRAFFEEFRMLATRYPAAAQRFSLVDFNDKPDRSLSGDGWDCFPFEDWTICEWSPPVQ